MQNSLNLVYGIVRAVAIIAVVATVAWWIAPFLIIFLIPSLIAQSKTAKAGWFVWDEKGDERHIYWGTTYLMARAKHQLEIRALQAQKTLFDTIETMLEKFQRKQRTILQGANWVIGPAKVFNNIFKHQAEKTTIIISHRFSTVRRADRIIVLNEGKIVEQGTHAELMKVKDGLYKDMFEKQAEGYR